MSAAAAGGAAAVGQGGVEDGDMGGGEEEEGEGVRHGKDAVRQVMGMKKLRMRLMAGRGRVKEEEKGVTKIQGAYVCILSITYRVPG